MKTTHALAFEVAEWEPIPGFPPAGDFMRFRVGTCEGLWSSDDRFYKVLAIDNSMPGNGHLNDVFEWFEHSCIRDKKDLLVMEVMNQQFKKHLINKRGFRPLSRDHVVKKYKQMKRLEH